MAKKVVFDQCFYGLDAFGDGRILGVSGGVSDEDLDIIRFQAFAEKNKKTIDRSVTVFHLKPKRVAIMMTFHDVDRSGRFFPFSHIVITNIPGYARFAYNPFAVVESNVFEKKEIKSYDLPYLQIEPIKIHPPENFYSCASENQLAVLIGAAEKRTKLYVFCDNGANLIAQTIVQGLLESHRAELSLSTCLTTPKEKSKQLLEQVVAPHEAELLEVKLCFVIGLSLQEKEKWKIETGQECLDMTENSAQVNEQLTSEFSWFMAKAITRRDNLKELTEYMSKELLQSTMNATILKFRYKAMFNQESSLVDFLYDFESYINLHLTGNDDFHEEVLQSIESRIKNYLLKTNNQLERFKSGKIDFPTSESQTFKEFEKLVPCFIKAYLKMENGEKRVERFINLVDLTMDHDLFLYTLLLSTKNSPLINKQVIRKIIAVKIHHFIDRKVSFKEKIQFFEMWYSNFHEEITTASQFSRIALAHIIFNKYRNPERLVEDVLNSLRACDNLNEKLSNIEKLLVVVERNSGLYDMVIQSYLTACKSGRNNPTFFLNQDFKISDKLFKIIVSQFHNDKRFVASIVSKYIEPTDNNFYKKLTGHKEWNDFDDIAKLQIFSFWYQNENSYRKNEIGKRAQIIAEQFVTRRTGVTDNSYLKKIIIYFPDWFDKKWWQNFLNLPRDDSENKKNLANTIVSQIYKYYQSTRSTTGIRNNEWEPLKNIIKDWFALSPKSATYHFDSDFLKTFNAVSEKKLHVQTVQPTRDDQSIGSVSQHLPPQPQHCITTEEDWSDNFSYTFLIAVFCALFLLSSALVYLYLDKSGLGTQYFNKFFGHSEEIHWSESVDKNRSQLVISPLNEKIAEVPQAKMVEPHKEQDKGPDL